MAVRPYISGGDGSGGVTDNTTDPNIPYKSGTALEDSNLSQDADGKIRATTQIIAEAGVDTPPGTITLGDGLDIKASGPQQINESRVTGIKYQLPYQVIDKTGTGRLFETETGAEQVNQPRQPIFDTPLTSAVTVPISSLSNEIVNAIYIRTDGDISNFRYQTTSVATGNAVDTYPNKFDYGKDIGVEIVGSGEHKIDLYYNVESTPSRFLAGQALEITMKWDSNEGTVLGNSSNIPYYGVDCQEFEFVDNINVKSSVTELSDVAGVGSGSIITTSERSIVADAVINSDTSIAAMQFVLDEDDMGSNSNIKIPTQQSVKKYVDDIVSSGVTLKGGYNAATNTPNLDTPPTGVELGWLYVVTDAGSFFSKSVSVGDALLCKLDNPQLETDWIIMCRDLDASTIKVLYESNANTEAFETLEKSNLGILTGTGDTTLHYHNTDRDRSNHTGTQTTSTISDFETSVTNNTSVYANTTHKTSDGKDHSDVVLNNTHRSSTSNPHSVLATQITDFDTEVSNNISVAANTSKVTFPEAPVDTKQYARKDAGWGEIVDAGGDMLSTNNLSDLTDDAIARTNLGVDTAGTDNSTNVTLATDDVTTDTLDLTVQEITVNAVTQTTDGAMLSEDKLKLDNMSDNCVGDSWVSGLDVNEQFPKDQTVNYTSGTYLINGMMKTITTGSVYDLENAYGSINHYTGLTSYQHRFVTLYVDVDEVIKSISGIAAEKKEVPPLPITPVNSVAIAVVEIKVDNSVIPKDIKNKEITDARNAPAYNTDEFVRVSADDLTVGHLSDKLSNNGNISFTIENPGVDETLKADYSPSINPRINSHVSSSFTMTGALTEFTIPFDVVDKSSGITLNSNEFTISEDGRYSGFVLYQMNEESDPKFYSWAELYPSGGSAWETIEDSLIYSLIKEDVSFTCVLNEEFYAGDKFRVRGMVENPPADKIDFQIKTRSVTYGTITQYPASISLTKVGEVTP